MAEVLKKYSQVSKKILGLLNKYLGMVTLAVAVACGIGIWHYCLTHTLDASWYKEFFETYTWCNWIVSVYFSYLFLVGGYHLFCSVNSRSIFIHGIIYSGIIAACFAVPALYPVRSIFGCYFHWLLSLGLVAWFLVEIVALFIEKNSKNTKSEQALVDVHWNTYVKSIIDFLNRVPKTKESYTIGVTGVWGSGKTTMLDYIKKELASDERYIVQSFNPWQLSSPEQVNTEFFGLLSTIVDKNSIGEGSIISLIKKYVKLLTLVPNTSIEGIEKILNVLPSESQKSLSKLHKDIDAALAKLDKRIVICIDDLDRLDYDELYEVLKIIRVSANFQNIVFILAYDKGYVAKNLNIHQIPNGEDFLKKIVNVEICLPAYETFKLLNYLWDLIDPYMPNDRDRKNEVLTAMRSAYTERGSYLLSEYFANFRDVQRFANYFAIVLTYLNQQQADNVDIKLNYGDLFWLEVIHYFSEDVYTKLKNDCWTLLDEKQYNKNFLELKKDNGLKPNDARCLHYLFPSNATRDKKTNICYANNLPSYFSYTLLEDTLSLPEFETVVFKPTNTGELYEQVTKLLESRKMPAFLTILRNSVTLYSMSQQDTVNYLRTILFVASKLSVESTTLKSLYQRFRDLCNSPDTKTYHIASEDVLQELDYAITNFQRPEHMNRFLTQLTPCWALDEDMEDQPETSILNWEDIKGLAE